MLNPITYTERVVGDFLKYQITTYAFADHDLHHQMRKLLSLEETRATPLMKGPYISLSRSFKKGATIAELAKEGILHRAMTGIAPFPNVYGHQERALRSIAAGRNVIISTGTGSGKTECFLYPVITHCLRLRDAGKTDGISAVIVYPMNALAEDQLGRLRRLLMETGVTYGMYIGKTPEKARDVFGKRLSSHASVKDYDHEMKLQESEKEPIPVHPINERPSREEMRLPGKRPQILLTNVKQLELLLTRERDIDLFDNASLDYLVFDEAHTFSGAGGAETACLIRRLRTFCGKKSDETVCIATSATIADPKQGDDISRSFASRFFGISESSVEVIGEEYEPQLWVSPRSVPDPLPGDQKKQLSNMLELLSDIEDNPESNHTLKAFKAAFCGISGSTLQIARWREDLYAQLSHNELLYQIDQSLQAPKLVNELIEDLSKKLSRSVTEEEILLWLALGAAAVRNEQPLLRPVVHAFIRGIDGAVVNFPEERENARLWLSAENAEKYDSALFRLPVLACTTCGQHYYEHYLQDFDFTGKLPSKGQAHEDSSMWIPLEKQRGGKRVLLLDRMAYGDETEEDEEELRHKKNAHPLYFCRHCGRLYPDDSKTCVNCTQEGSLVKVHVLKQDRKHPGMLTSCIACHAPLRVVSGQEREAARPVRAITVSDVHILVQNMIHHAERRRLLVFTDNRQDAAFQAGWMKDHARRFRFRELMYEYLKGRPLTLGDLTHYMDEGISRDDELSETLLPEVWRFYRKESSPRHHGIERKRFIRLQLLQESAMGMRQPTGLEPLGRMKVDYQGLDAGLPFFQKWAKITGCRAEILKEGIASLLDHFRRNKLLLDKEDKIFTRYWSSGDREIQNGYLLPHKGGPRGIKFKRKADDKKERLSQFMSDKGITTAMDAAHKFGVPGDQVEPFLNELWKLLTTNLQLVVPVRIKSRTQKIIPGTQGASQIDADKLILQANKGLYRCDTCRRVNLRRTPNLACTAYRCKGKLQYEKEDPDNYDLNTIDQQITMIRPEEHSAQVPQRDRELREILFKSDEDKINTLVCTPTLELGVDIGSLDAVLMRNVPPLPANYKQRSGRAGRRHRMSVCLTYSRPASHDRAYYVDPLKMLEGKVYPPSFNLKNEFMIRKHTHAAILTTLNSLKRKDIGKNEKHYIGSVMNHCFPVFIRDYLFDEQGHILDRDYNVSEISVLTERYGHIILDNLTDIFSQNWPGDDTAVVKKECLQLYIKEATDQLKQVIDRLHKRLEWAMDQINKLSRSRSKKGTLDPSEEELFRRCDRLVKKMKGKIKRSSRETAGYDDTYTYNVLAAEGFLPGYGLDKGAVNCHYLPPPFDPRIREWELKRETALALREYIPGNLVYANGHRYAPRYYHLTPQEAVKFQVDIKNEAVNLIGSETNAQSSEIGIRKINAVPMCDVDLPHISTISDEELFRFHLGTAVYGYEQDRHREGKSYQWGDMNINHRAGVYLKLVNIGPVKLVQNTGKIGYPLCLSCGQSRSPLASESELNSFREDHKKRCGKRVQSVGFYADITADALTLKDCPDRSFAYSVMESLRQGAARVLEMENEDLQLLAIGHTGSEAVDVMLYDPMPGGSGLLNQMLDRWDEVTASALELAENCPSACDKACIDCLMNFRNAFCHRYLDRKKAAETIRKFGSEIDFVNDIPARFPEKDHEKITVNAAEETLKCMLQKAGFQNFETQYPIKIGKPYDRTIPDFFFNDPTERLEGICIYLDGMSKHYHGNTETAQKDNLIRTELRNSAYEVIEITYTQLFDRNFMKIVFYRLGRLLLGKSKADKIKNDLDWFLGEGD